MNPRNRLDDDLKSISDKIRDLIRKDCKILILSNPSADGIAAGSIIFQTLERLNAKCVLRSAPGTKDSLRVGYSFSDEYDLCFLIDFEHEPVEKLNRSLKNEWILIRHLSNEIASESDEANSLRVLNINKYELNGWSEINSGGICYLLSIAFDTKNSDRICTSRTVFPWRETGSWKR